MQITFPKDMKKQNRFRHTIAVLQLSSNSLKFVTFGGCPSLPSNAMTDDDLPKLANTIISKLSELCHVCVSNVCVCVQCMRCVGYVVWL